MSNTAISPAATLVDESQTSSVDISKIIGLVTNEELGDTADQVDKLLTQGAWRVMNMVAFD